MKYKRLFITFFVAGIILRMLLCWMNPPENSFDDYFEPIFFIINNGMTPPKNACFQCYHPPVFPWISALIGIAAIQFGMTMPNLAKLLQFLPCFYGILTIGLCYLIMKKLQLTDDAKLLSFGIVCFLPRHIYMSAMNTNDTLSYLMVSLCIYVMTLMLVDNFSWYMLSGLSILVTVSVFVKYTNFIVFPAVLVLFISLLRHGGMKANKAILCILVTLLLPSIVLTSYMQSNVSNYGSVLPWNVHIYDPSLHRPRDTIGIIFSTFKPWEEIKAQMLIPGKLNSFWTLLYSNTWFDTEPFFQKFLDGNVTWWEKYYAWYRGEGIFPGENPSRSWITITCGSGLISLGLLPLLLLAFGVYEAITGKWKRHSSPLLHTKVIMDVFLVLIFFNVAGIIALVLRMPVYNSMKASYLLSSLPAFAYFMGLGFMAVGKNRKIKLTIFCIFGTIFTLSIVHFFQIILSLA